VSRGEGELLTVLKPRAVGLLPVCLTMKPVGEPDALIGHVRFDERGWETERCRMAQATAPILDSTESALSRRMLFAAFGGGEADMPTIAEQSRFMSTRPGRCRARILACPLRPESEALSDPSP
jgi:hypothetical protein